MNIWLTRLLIALVTLTLLAISGLAVFILTLDQSVYKARLQAAVQAQFNRTLRIDGNLEVSVFPRVALTVQDISLSEKGREETFATIKRAGIALEVWPLLHRRLVIDGITVNGLDMQIVRDRDGRLNLSDLFRPDNVVTAVSAADGWDLGAADAVQIDISSITIRDAQVRLLDKMPGVSVNQSLRFSGLDLTTGRISLGKPFAVALSGKIESVGSSVEARVAARSNVELSAVAKTFAFTDVNVTLTQGALRDGQPLTDVEATLAIPTLRVVPEQERLELQRLSFRAKGLRAGAPFEATLDLPAFTLSSARFEAAHATGRLRVDGPDAIDLRAGLTDFGGSARSWRAVELSLDVGYKRKSLVTKLALTSPLEVRPHESFATLSALHGEISAAEPALPRGLLHVPVTGSVLAAWPQQQLQIDLTLGLDESRRVASTFSGLAHIKSSTTLDLQETGMGALAVRGEATGVGIKSLSSVFGADSFIDGTGTVGVDLQMLTRGKNPAVHSLTGTIKTQFGNGSMAGVDLSAGIDALRALTRTDRKDALIKVDRNLRTAFSTMQADFAFKNGIGVLTRLDLVAPALHITQGKPAQINLIDETIDVVANVQVSGALSVPGGKVSIQVRDLVVPLHVSGALTHPDLSIELGALASTPLSRVLQQGLLPDIPELRGFLPQNPGSTDQSQQRQQRIPAK